MEVDEIAACGLVCGVCRRYRKGSCPGCCKYEKTTWCEVRTCCREHGWMSCADCTQIPIAQCRKFNGFVSKVFGFVFRSDRLGCVERIRVVGYDAYWEEMRSAGRMNRPVTKK